MTNFSGAKIVKVGAGAAIGGASAINLAKK